MVILYFYGFAFVNEIIVSVIMLYLSRKKFFTYSIVT